MPEAVNSIFEFLIERPLVMLVLMAFPLLLVARFWKIFPSHTLLICAAIPAAFSILMLAFPLVGWYVLGLDGLLILVAIVDCFTVIPATRFSATRRLSRIASLNKPQTVELELINQATRSCRLDVKDDLPLDFVATPAQYSLAVGGRSRTLFRYHYTSSSRGQQEFRCVYLRVFSRWGMWRGNYRIPCRSIVHVYPDMKQIAEYEMLAKTNRLALLGMRRTRKIGQDHEFERLRDYTPDDNFKHIDWRTTARRQKLTVKDFQSNQSQRIIFLIDCGRMMTGTDGKLSLLDHSLNAMLMLSYVALKRGDSVGLISFSNAIHNFTPPRSGVKHINRLLHASFNQQPSHVESRYNEAFLYLRSHCHKRSLVVLMTNVIDDVNANQIRQYMTSLTGLHLPLGVFLRDRAIFSAVEDVDLENPDTVFRAAAAVDVLTWRQQVIGDLKHAGVLALDVFPQQLTSKLVNQYLEIKARHLL